MAVTHIDTNALPRVSLGDGHGEMTEIINEALCGAENVVASLRWLKPGERFQAEPLAATHQLIYLMEGEGVVTLQQNDYDVRKGSGVYLGPSESASVRQRGGTVVKLFHLVVPVKTDS